MIYHLFRSFTRYRTCSLFFSLLICGAANAGFSISGTQLLDANGNEFIMRGVNHAHTWYTQTTAQALIDIASVNANTVRVVLSSGDRWNKNSAADVASVIEQLKANKLIGVLEIHDTTGYGEEAAAASLDQAVDYWVSLADVLKGEEDYIIINIGNEPIGNYVADEIWVNDHIAAIKRLRAAGFTHTLMVDAPSWGQDWELGMFNNADKVAAADNLKNTLFSVHLYQVYPTYDAVYNYVTQFMSQYQVPIIIGEFADVTINGTDVAGEEAMAIAEELGIGYLGWSWSGNTGSDFADQLDITINFDVDNLSTWGDILINGKNGLKATARLATVFESTMPPPVPPIGLSCNIERTSTWQSGYQLDVSVTNYSVEAVEDWVVELSYTGDAQVKHYWNANVTSDGNIAIASNTKWNGHLAAGASVAFGIQGSYTDTFVEPTCSSIK